MRIPEKYSLTLWLGKTFRLEGFGQKQLECGLLYSGLWMLIPSAVDWHRWPAWVVIAGLAWYSWADLFRFIAFPSTWCKRCRKRKIIAWEMTPREKAVEGQWMRRCCYGDYSPQARLIRKAQKGVRGLRDLMRWLSGGGTSPRGPLPDYPPESLDWTDEK